MQINEIIPMPTYQIINLQTGRFERLSLEEVADIAQLDLHDIEWAIEEHGLCETNIHRITKLPEPPEECDAIDTGDGDSIIALPVSEQFEAPAP